jgi:hypothetical protein
MMKVIAFLPSTPHPLAITCLLAPNHFLLRPQLLTHIQPPLRPGDLDGSHDCLNLPHDRVAAVKGGERRST